MNDKEKRKEIGKLLKENIHLYQFHGKVDKKEIEKIEMMNIQLPIDYQWFLRNLGWIKNLKNQRVILGIETKDFFTVFHPQKEAKYMEQSWGTDEPILILEIIQETENTKIFRYIHAVDSFQETAPIWEATVTGDYWNRFSKSINKEIVFSSFYDYFLDYIN